MLVNLFFFLNFPVNLLTAQAINTSAPLEPPPASIVAIVLNVLLTHRATKQDQPAETFSGYSTGSSSSSSSILSTKQVPIRTLSCTTYY